MSPVAPADTALSLADPAVPGLSAVLDPLALVQRLAPGWGIAGAQIRYLRYKRGTSLVAGLELTAGDGATSLAQAFALGPGASDKLAKVVLAGEADDVGRGVAVDRGLGAGLTDVTADRHLPGVRRVLRDLAGDDVATPLVYKPGRRWVTRIDRADGPVLVKVHRPGALPGVRAGDRALRGLPVSLATTVRQRRGIVTSPWVPGTALDRFEGPGVAELWSCAGDVLAQIHRRPPTTDLVRVDRALLLAGAVEAVRAIAPDLAGDARAVADRIRTGLAGDQALHVVHGDFSADQVIVHPHPPAPTAGNPDQPAVTVVDLDRVGLDYPVADLASWYGADVAAGGQPDDPHAALAPLLAGYQAAGGPADLSRLRLQSAAAVLQRATEPFRRHVRDWPQQVARLVALSRELST